MVVPTFLARDRLPIPTLRRSPILNLWRGRRLSGRRYAGLQNGLTALSICGRSFYRSLRSGTEMESASYIWKRRFVQEVLFVCLSFYSERKKAFLGENLF